METSALEAKEGHLAQQLRLHHCHLNGREISPTDSAAILHELGLIYMKRSPDKVSLIRSAALLNAAFWRNPTNVSLIQDDIRSLCSLVLSEASAVRKEADLIEAASNINEQVKKMREEVDENLINFTRIPSETQNEELHQMEAQKISSVQKLQNEIAKAYTAIMNDLSHYCVEVMGEPPCRFSLVGMGSLARREITPYSDFEHVILLEEGIQEVHDYNEILEYFRWFTVVFQIVVINLGETIVPSVAVPSLNCYTIPKGDWFFDAYTKRGVSFDGFMPQACKSPLGRQEFTTEKPFSTELIKPVSEMVHYIDVEEDIKNGYHLADILTNTCYVFGDESIYCSFQAAVRTKLSIQRRNSSHFYEELKNQIAEDKINFDMIENLNKLWWRKSKFNLKRVIYRSTTIFISALGSYFGIEESSCFDIIKKMAERGLITEEEAHKLNYVIAVACEVRLKIYAEKKSQDDWVSHHSAAGNDTTGIVQAVGERTIVDYMVIACGLQDSVSNLILHCTDGPIKLHLHNDEKLSAQVCCALHLHDRCLHLCKLQLDNLERSSMASGHDNTAISLLNLMGISLINLNKPVDALQQFQKRLMILEEKSTDRSTDADIANCVHSIGNCMKSMRKFDEALAQFEQGLNIRRRISADLNADEDIAICKNLIGICKNTLNRHVDALPEFEQGLHIRKRMSADEATDLQVADCIGNIAICMTNLHQYGNALNHFEQELTIRKRASPDETADRGIANCLRNIGICLKIMNKHKDAIDKFEAELEIRKRISTDENGDVNVAKCLHLICICMVRLEDYSKALPLCKLHLDLRKRISADETRDVLVADCMHLIGVCLTNTKNDELALESLQAELKIRQNISTTDTDVRVTYCIRLIGICMINLDRLNEGLTQFQKRAIARSVSL